MKKNKIRFGIFKIKRRCGKMQKLVYKKNEKKSEKNSLKKINLTENQLKVIKDKYLRDSPSPEEWIYGVAENIALTEILHCKDIDYSEIFEGVDYEIQEYNDLPYPSQIILLHNNMKKYNEQNRNFKIFLGNLYRLARTDRRGIEAVSAVREKFYNIMANFEFLPNSPTLMNAGRELQQLSACYVLPVGDSIDEIYDSVKHMAIIHKSGGGTGFSFSRLRPANDDVQSTKGISSGPVSFMQIFDKSTEVVKQGGTRRGANMGILRYDHPDIMKFIHAKDEGKILENFNISVAIDEKFMKAVRNNDDYELVNPRDGGIAGKLNARKVFDALVQSAWATGDPGIVVIDRINNSDSNPTPHIGQIESTNPCGEQPLLPYEPCNLGSINLSKFVLNDGSEIDYGRLRTCVHDCVHFLDNVIDINNYPLPQIEIMAKNNRRIGLGVMGWAEALVMLGLPYNSSEAYEKSEEVMRFVNEESLVASENLAKVRGVFPNWKNSIFDKDGDYFKGTELLPRNCARTTIAPTGTIGITAGLQGAGIEPFFAVVYVRYNAAALDKLKKGETPDLKDCFYEVNPLFKEIARKNNYFGLRETELWEKIEDNHKSVVGIIEIPEEIQNVFLTSHDLSPMDHVMMQIAFQKHTNNAVSKTVNLINEATAKDIEEVYLRAYEGGLKGITIYRDGCKQFQVLNISEKKESRVEKKKYSAFGEMSNYYEVETGQGPMHIHVNYDLDGPRRIFVNISPTGTEISGLTTAVGILLSKYLELGGDPIKILKHLNSIKGDKPHGFGIKRVDSIPHGISKALRDHLIRTGKIVDAFGLNGNGQEQKKIVSFENERKQESALYCPKCYSSNVSVMSGCSGPTCFDCGFSECS